ncbi:hypothetical protein A2995_00585 [Candidatus Nomurabacteria bacterium RIFCSPLOWO2_01_FULL_33_24]|uniref:Uncharacterized protein n=1 Tax=Candidatus Nomurabacteria bacterium RIFCSPLOWO2_01_FULL_33_24 TaxID=1801765 RepID=A0A1F6X0V3_9BACT|nr:MAG: hypothetical protein A2995_00585 [Candidatus Nomurabacteria bacterium RIFCSPLOWO2_01_FULL_33_24]
MGQEKKKLKQRKALNQRMGTAKRNIGKLRKNGSRNNLQILTSLKDFIKKENIPLEELGINQEELEKFTEKYGDGNNFVRKIAYKNNGKIR